MSFGRRNSSLYNPYSPQAAVGFKRNRDAELAHKMSNVKRETIPHPSGRVSQFHKGKTCVSHFEGIGEYCDYLLTLPEYCFVDTGIPGLPSWSQNPQCPIDHKQNPKRRELINAEIERMRLGSIEHAEKAEKVLDQLAQTGLLSPGEKLPERHIVGSTTIMPLYDMGVPKCMIYDQPSDIEGAFTPIRIFYDRFASAGLCTDQLINRGVACLAFTLAMASVRPVELYVISCSCPDWPGYGGLFGSLIQIETQPLNLAHAAYIMTSEALTRSFTWAAMHDHSYRWAGVTCHENHRSAVGPFCGVGSHTPEYNQGMRDAFNMEDQDILLHGANVFDKLALTDPVAWTKRMIAKHIKRRAAGLDALSSESTNDEEE